LPFFTERFVFFTERFVTRVAACDADDPDLPVAALGVTFLSAISISPPPGFDLSQHVTDRHQGGVPCVTASPVSSVTHLV
jgi:hypothetical protein